MSDLDNAINSINASAAKAENTAGFLDDMSTFDDQSSVTNPNNGQTVASIPKQVKDRTDELFTAAESDINQAVSDAAQSATDAQDAADSIGRYQGLWPDTGGSANKGDTYQTQVSGTPTGRYFTALQNTTVDPVGDNVNWKRNGDVNRDNLSGYTDIVYKASGGNSAVENMIAGIPVAAKVGDAIQPTGSHVERISDDFGSLQDFGYFKEINLKSLGAKADNYIAKVNAISDILGTAYDNIVNPNRTDNYQIIKNALDGVDPSIGATILLDRGSYYCSQELDIVYTTSNPWLQQFGTGTLHLKGCGTGVSQLVFPSSTQYGVTVNRQSGGLTSVKLSGFSVYREGFNPRDYLARPVEDDFDFSSEPNFGAGVYGNQIGYFGGVSDITSRGFYASFYFTRVFGGTFDRLFSPVKQSIYGMLLTSNTTVDITNSSFWGYQTCYGSLNGNIGLTGVICEGTMFPMGDDPDLMDLFHGHSFYQNGGTLSMDNCYTEKCVGYSRGLVGVRYHEINGRLSNGLDYHYFATTPSGDVLSQALKDKIDIYNPDLTNIMWDRTTSDRRPKGKITASSMFSTDRVKIIDPTVQNGSSYSDSLSIYDTLYTQGSYGSSLENTFGTGLLPSQFDYSRTPYAWENSGSLNAGTLTNKTQVTIDYDAFYAGKGCFSVNRLLNANDYVNRAGIGFNVDLSGYPTIGHEVYTGVYSRTYSPSIEFRPGGASIFYANLAMKTDATNDIGGSGTRVKDMYIVNPPTVGSDERVKHDIQSIPQNLCDIAISTEIKQYKLHDGTSGRTHYGIVVNQELLNKIEEAVGVDNCAAFVHQNFTSESGEPITKQYGDIEIGEMWMVRYDEWQNIMLEAMRRKINTFSSIK